MIDWFGSSILIVPLAATALLATAIVCERLWVLRIGVLMPSAKLEYIYSVIGDTNALETLRYTSDNSFLQRLFIVALAHEQGGQAAMREAVRFEGELLAHELQRFLNTLGTLAMIAPLLGLLGTVLGLIQSFSVMFVGAASTDLTPELSQGIAGALITTAIGLFIAIPAVLFHRLLQRRVYSLVIELEKHCLQLLLEYRGIHRVSER